MQKSTLAVIIGAVIIFGGVGTYMYLDSQPYDGPSVTSLTIIEPESIVTPHTLGTTWACCFMVLELDVKLYEKSSTKFTGGPDADVYYGDRWLGRVHADGITYGSFIQGYEHPIHYNLESIYQWQYGDKVKLISTGEKIPKNEIYLVVDTGTIPDSWMKCMTPDCTVKVV